MRMKFAAYSLLALIFVAPAAFALDGITLASVDGLYQGNLTQLECGVPVKIFLRLQNDTGGPAAWTVQGSANGFRIYSTDNATWTPDFTVDTTIVLFPPPASTTYDTIWYGQFVPPATAGLVWNNPGTGEFPIYDGGLFVNTFSTDGAGSDTVGFAGFTQTSGVGLYESFNEIAFEIDILSIDCGSHNRTICLDSAFYFPSGNWLWSGTDINDQYKCSWDGPHCWTIKDPNATSATYSTPLTNNTINFDVGPDGGDRDTTFTVTSTPTTAPVGFTLAVGTWLSCSKSSGTTPSNFTLTFDPTGQPLSVLTDTLYITDVSKGANAVVQTIVVNFDVALDVKGGTGNLPTVYSLSQNYPNPFNPTTTIKFALPEATNVSLDIYNVLGQKVRSLVNEPLAANNYEVEWDGRNERGSEVASGIYFYKLQTDSFVNTKKMILSR